MTTPNRIVFQATGKPHVVGDFAQDVDGSMLMISTEAHAKLFRARPAYRRIDTPAPDSRLLEVATAIYAANVAGRGGQYGDVSPEAIAKCVSDARALIAACEGATQ